LEREDIPGVERGRSFLRGGLLLDADRGSLLGDAPFILLDLVGTRFFFVHLHQFGYVSCFFLAESDGSE